MPVRPNSNLRARQLTLPGLPKARTQHGGEYARGKRKLRRPFDPGKPLHLVFRSPHARGEWSMLHPRHKGWIHLQALRLSHRFRVKCLGFTNVGNHLHLVVQASRKENLQSFLRCFPGLIARRVMGAEKGSPAHLPAGERFWEGLVFSRIVQWGRDFGNARAYLSQNLREALGIPRVLRPVFASRAVPQGGG